MKQLWRITERYYPWLLLLLGVDCFCAIILWISDIQAFQTLIGLVVLTSLLLFSVILFVLNKRETTRRELFRDFLSDPTHLQRGTAAQCHQPGRRRIYPASGISFTGTQN